MRALQGEVWGRDGRRRDEASEWIGCWLVGRVGGWREELKKKDWYQDDLGRCGRKN